MWFTWFLWSPTYVPYITSTCVCRCSLGWNPFHFFEVKSCSWGVYSLHYRTFCWLTTPNLLFSFIFLSWVVVSCTVRDVQILAQYLPLVFNHKIHKKPPSFPGVSFQHPWSQGATLSCLMLSRVMWAWLYIEPSLKIEMTGRWPSR